MQSIQYAQDTTEHKEQQAVAAQLAASWPFGRLRRAATAVAAKCRSYNCGGSGSASIAAGAKRALISPVCQILSCVSPNGWS